MSSDSGILPLPLTLLNLAHQNHTFTLASTTGYGAVQKVKRFKSVKLFHKQKSCYHAGKTVQTYPAPGEFYPQTDSSSFSDTLTP